MDAIELASERSTGGMYTAPESHIRREEDSRSSESESVDSTGRVKEGKEREGVVVDAVWGEIDDTGPNYRNLGWIRATVLEVKLQIGLGILGLPVAFSTLGYVPGVLCIALIGCIMTWTGYVVGAFKLRHPEIYTVADVGQLIWGPIGREVLGFIFWIETVATAGAMLLSISTAFNAITAHAACTVIWAVIGAILVGLVSAIQTLDRVAWLGWIGLVSIVSSVIVLMVAIGVNGHPSIAPIDFVLETKAFGQPSFLEAMQAVSVIVFAYAGIPNFFTIIGEMKRPQDYPRSVITCHTFVTTVYLIVACVVYHFAGQFVASPALGTAGSLIKRVCYGIALPSLIVGGMLFAHTGAKYAFVRILRKSRHLARNTPVHYMVWYGTVAVTIGIAFIIAQSIPVFNDLLSLIGSLLATNVTIQLQTYMWMWDHWNDTRTMKWRLMMGLNMLIFCVGVLIMVTGTISSVKTINHSLKTGGTTKPFSCADNSGGV